MTKKYQIKNIFFNLIGPKYFYSVKFHSNFSFIHFLYFLELAIQPSLNAALRPRNPNDNPTNQPGQSTSQNSSCSSGGNNGNNGATNSNSDQQQQAASASQQNSRSATDKIKDLPATDLQSQQSVNSDSQGGSSANTNLG